MNHPSVIDQSFEADSFADGPSADEQDGLLTEPVSGDQRRSYRYPAQSGRETATLRAAGKDLAAKLIDESAGGLSLELPAKFAVAVDQLLEVGIYSGWYRAKVKHIQSAGRVQHVGLQRLALIASSNGEVVGVGRPKPYRQFGWHNRIMAFFVICAAVAAGMGISQWYAAPAHHPHLGAASLPAADGPESQKLAGIMDGVNMLTKPDVAKGLKLTRDQQTAVNGILVGVSNQLAAAYEESKDDSPDVWYGKSQVVVHGAIEDVLCSLTEDQVDKWRAILLHQRERPDAKGVDRLIALRRAAAGLLG